MFWRVWGLNQSLVLLQLLLAWSSGMATMSQMKDLGYNTGVPALCHGGWWTDLLVVGVMTGVILNSYSRQWRLGAIIVWFGISGFAISYANLVYIDMSKTVPNFTAVAGHLTPAGVVHLFYSTGVFAVALLFWFETKRVISYKHVLWIGLGSLAHIAAGYMQPAYLASESVTTPGLLAPLVAALLLLVVGVIRLTWIAR